MFNESIPANLQKYLGKPDFRVKDLFPLNSPLWFLIVFAVYFAFVKFGTKYMAHRKAFDLNRVLIFFNAFQVSFSFYIGKEVIVSAYKMRYNIVCQHMVQNMDPNGFRMAHACWLFYISKYIDLIDTVFLILKKKTNQLSYLHLYHHSTMLFDWYIGILYLPGGQPFLGIFMNCFVHVVMYSYYFLAAFGPNVQKYLWWKKYLTQIQLIQFVIMITHVSMGGYCGAIPIWLTTFIVTYLISLITLFVNFYVKSYTKLKSNIDIIKNISPQIVQKIKAN